MAAPAARAAAFGYTSSGGYYTVTTGAGLVFKIHQSTGGMTSLNFNGTELQPSGTNESHVESGLPSPTVSAQQTGNYIIITASTSTWYGSGTLHHYYVAVNGQNNVYMATYVGSARGVRWIQYLNRSILTNINTPSDVRGGTAIESADIDLVNGQTRSKYYSNRQAMNLTPRGVTGSGIGVYMAYGTRESSSGGPFFRDIEQQGTSASVEVYNYMWSGHNDTEPQRLGVLYGPYALMVGGTSTPAAPDMSFMYNFGFAGSVAPSGRGFVSGAASGVPRAASRWWAGRTAQAQYWTTLPSNGNFTSPAMKPGTYTQTLYQGELGVATRTVTVPPARRPARTSPRPGSPRPARFSGSAPGTAPRRFLNWANLTSMHPSDTRMASWGPSRTRWAAVQPRSSPPISGRRQQPHHGQVHPEFRPDRRTDGRIGITAAYASGRPQITVNNWTSAAPAASPSRTRAA